MSNEDSQKKKNLPSTSAPLTQITFASLGLSESLVKACEALGWKHPTKIQAEAIPYALKGRDVIGLAQTGSGKTASFALPILDALQKNPAPLFALVLAPTRELAFQISEQFEALGGFMKLTCAVIVGGIDVMTQAICLAKKPHIVIGTPGRIVYHLQHTRGFSLKTIKFLVLDEADRLLNLDFEEEIDTILKVLPKERTSFLYSATMTNKVSKLQRASLRNPVKVEVSTKYSTVDTLVQHYLFIPEKLKDAYLVFLLNEFAGNSILVFAAQCATAHRLSLMLRHLGFKAMPLHGKMTQHQRLGSLNHFKASTAHHVHHIHTTNNNSSTVVVSNTNNVATIKGSTCDILVATDVASRGLDIPQVDLVINYDIPLHTKDYIHRVGRTARAGASGRAINFVTQYDVEQYQRIEEYLGKKLSEYSVDEEQVQILLERVSEAARYAQMDMRESGFGKKRKRSSSNEDEEEEDSTSEEHSLKIKKRLKLGSHKKKKSKPK